MSLGLSDLSCWTMTVQFSSAEVRQHVWDDLVGPRSRYEEISSALRCELSDNFQTFRVR